MPDWGVALAVSQVRSRRSAEAGSHIGERHPIADD
jgi:hypothetical protein